MNENETLVLLFVSRVKSPMQSKGLLIWHSHQSFVVFFLDRDFHNKSIYTLAEITHWAEITHFSRNHTFMFWHEESPLPGEEVNMDLLDKIKVEYYWLYQLMFLSSQGHCRNNCKKKISRWVQKLKEWVHMYGVWLSFSSPFF